MSKALTVKERIFLDNNITMGYHWLTVNDMVNPAYNIASYLVSIKDDLKNKKGNDKVKNEFYKRIDDLMDDVKREADRLDQDIMENVIHAIPDRYKTMQDKLNWITKQNILNFFASGDFEAGFHYLITFAEIDPDFYESILPDMKNNISSLHVLPPLLKYTSLAVDLFGYEFLSYFEKEADEKFFEAKDREIQKEKNNI